MNKHRFAALALCAGTAAAQEPQLTVTVGARAWYTEWTTFSYYVDPADNTRNLALIQVSADNELVLVPVANVRYGDFSVSASMFPSTEFSMTDGRQGRRREYDLNLGYAVLPGLSVTLGYKKLLQTDGVYRYEPAGPLLGVYAGAPLDGPFSVYGSFAAGRLKTRASPDEKIVQFKSDYRLTEVGLAYSLNGGALVQRWAFTLGYRMQVMGSKEAFETQDGKTQDGRDVTQGLSFGVLATF